MLKSHSAMSGFFYLSLMVKERELFDKAGTSAGFYN
jgi:hypothetical protein